MSTPLPTPPLPTPLSTPLPPPLPPPSPPSSPPPSPSPSPADADDPDLSVTRTLHRRTHFWSIVRDGATVTTNHGKGAGPRGRRDLRTFPTPAHARQWARNAWRNKIALGYHPDPQQQQEQKQPEKHTPTTPPPSSPSRRSRRKRARVAPDPAPSPPTPQPQPIDAALRVREGRATKPRARGRPRARARVAPADDFDDQVLDDLRHAALAAHAVHVRAVAGTHGRGRGRGRGRGSGRGLGLGRERGRGRGRGRGRDARLKPVVGKQPVVNVDTLNHVRLVSHSARHWIDLRVCASRGLAHLVCASARVGCDPVREVFDAAGDIDAAARELRRRYRALCGVDHLASSALDASADAASADAASADAASRSRARAAAKWREVELADAADAAGANGGGAEWVCQVADAWVPMQWEGRVLEELYLEFCSNEWLARRSICASFGELLVDFNHMSLRVGDRTSRLRRVVQQPVPRDANHPAAVATDDHHRGLHTPQQHHPMQLVPAPTDAPADNNHHPVKDADNHDMHLHRSPTAAAAAAAADVAGC